MKEQKMNTQTRGHKMFMSKPEMGKITEPTNSKQNHFIERNTSRDFEMTTSNSSSSIDGYRGNYSL